MNADSLTLAGADEGWGMLELMFEVRSRNFMDQPLPGRKSTRVISEQKIFVTVLKKWQEHCNHSFQLN